VRLATFEPEVIVYLKYEAAIAVCFSQAKHKDNNWNVCPTGTQTMRVATKFSSQSQRPTLNIHTIYTEHYV